MSSSVRRGVPNPSPGHVQVMPDRRWLRPEDLNAFKEGQVWERIKGRHEPSVKIVREVLVSRLGRRFLVEGLTSQRQWWVTETTLLYSYKPKPTQ